MSLLEWFIRKWTAIKIYINRAISYITIINAGMMLFVLMAQMKQLGWNINLTAYFVPVYIISIIGAIIVGFVDTKLGFFKKESEMTSDRNPYFVEIKKDIKELKASLEELKNQKKVV